MSSPVIRMEGVEYRYQAESAPALSEVSLAVERGECVALIGATGSGKSTLLQIIAGLLLPSAGRCRVLETELSDPKLKERELDRLRRRCVIALQRPEQMLFKTWVGDDVAFGPRNYGLSGKELALRVRDAMGKVGLDYSAFKDRRCDALSGGEKRKAALAGVLALDPEILLLDEPSAGLDPASTAEIEALFTRLRREGRTLIFATHNMEQAAAADRVLCFAEGRLFQEGSPARLFRNDELRSASPFLAPDSVRLEAALTAAGFPLGSEGVPSDPEEAAHLIAAVLARGRGARS